MYVFQAYELTSTSAVCWLCSIYVSTGSVLIVFFAFFFDSRTTLIVRQQRGKLHTLPVASLCGEAVAFYRDRKVICYRYAASTASASNRPAHDVFFLIYNGRKLEQKPNAIKHWYSSGVSIEHTHARTLNPKTIKPSRVSTHHPRNI